jgi:hypothetical protein
MPQRAFGFNVKNLNGSGYCGVLEANAVAFQFSVSGSQFSVSTALGSSIKNKRHFRIGIDRELKADS